MHMYMHGGTTFLKFIFTVTLRDLFFSTSYWKKFQACRRIERIVQGMPTTLITQVFCLYGLIALCPLICLLVHPMCISKRTAAISTFTTKHFSMDFHVGLLFRCNLHAEKCTSLKCTFAVLTNEFLTCVTQSCARTENVVVTLKIPTVSLPCQSSNSGHQWSNFKKNHKDWFYVFQNCMYGE